jgi:hypothetical protein
MHSFLLRSTLVLNSALLFGNCWSPSSCSVYQRLLLNVCSSCKSCSSARYASAANVVCRDLRILSRKRTP